MIFKIILLLIMPLANFSQTDKPLFAGGIFIMENENEIWKPVNGFEGLYHVSNLGRVKALEKIVVSFGFENKRKEKFLKHSETDRGYLKFVLYKDGIRKQFKAHRLVALNFIPNPENKPDVNHINGIKSDNRIENLEWVTKSENIIHSCKMGLHNVVKYKIASKQYQNKLE